MKESTLCGIGYAEVSKTLHQWGDDRFLIYNENEGYFANQFKIGDKVKLI